MNKSAKINPKICLNCDMEMMTTMVDIGSKERHSICPHCNALWLERDDGGNAIFIVTEANGTGYWIEAPPFTLIILNESELHDCPNCNGSTVHSQDKPENNVIWTECETCGYATYHNEHEFDYRFTRHFPWRLLPQGTLLPLQEIEL